MLQYSFTKDIAEIFLESIFCESSAYVATFVRRICSQDYHELHLRQIYDINPRRRQFSTLLSTEFSRRNIKRICTKGQLSRPFYASEYKAAADGEASLSLHAGRSSSCVFKRDSRHAWLRRLCRASTRATRCIIHSDMQRVQRSNAVTKLQENA